MRDGTGQGAGRDGPDMRDIIADGEISAPEPKLHLFDFDEPLLHLFGFGPGYRCGANRYSLRTFLNLPAGGAGAVRTASNAQGRLTQRKCTLKLEARPNEPKGPLHHSQGPLERPQGPLGRLPGPLERLQGPLERPQGLFGRFQGPLERVQGPLVHPGST